MIVGFWKFLFFCGICARQIFGFIIEPRVVNGTDAKISDFPFAVSLRRHGRHFCGGTLISPEWVLTAGHCFVNRTSDRVLHSSTNTDVPVNHSTAVAIENDFLHERYYKDDLITRNDISLIHLKKRITSPFKNFTVKLPKFNQTFTTGTKVTLIGWGRSYTIGPSMKTLQKVDLTLYESKDCQKFYKETSLQESNLCIGFPGGYKGQCFGDSGSPVLIDDMQIGIVSWGRTPCGHPSNPGVITATAFYIDWIKDNTWETKD